MRLIILIGLLFTMNSCTPEPMDCVELYDENWVFIGYFCE